MTITAIPGVRVGHWTDAFNHTGCTVVVLPEPNVTAVEVRGGATGTREIELLGVGSRVEQVQAILLTGGSAFGLAAADGVVAALLADGRGHPTPAGPVPLVPAAVVYDLPLEGEGARPGPAAGAAAYRAASDGPVEMGLVGAGRGTSSAKWRGFEHRRPTGVGSAHTVLGSEEVGALVVLNPVGDVFSLEGTPLTGGPPVPPVPAAPPRPLANTTLAVVATRSAFARSELVRVAIRAQDAIAACVRPSHTRFDGDVVFVSACGTVPGDVDLAAEAAFTAVGRSIAAAVAAAG
jgi:L-aminopeptidase/D-esterase-like protein